MKPKLLVILGPTACGKTALSLELARAFNGEIVSADSRQIYRGMDIATDKLPAEKRQGIPHHMIDVADPDQLYTLTDYKRDAEQAIDDIISRGKLPILVGGTGLYISAVIENYQLATVPRDEALRKELEGKPLSELVAMLRALDPDTAVDLNNPPRVIRALEVARATGEGVSVKTAEPNYDVLLLQPTYEREGLYARIDSRVDEHRGLGVLEEAKRLAEKYGWDIPPMTGIGYRQYRPCINGTASIEACSEAAKRDSRNYAKRQMTWFKRYSERIQNVASATEAQILVSQWLDKI